MCPIHVAPVLRGREEALEASGLVAPLDSAGVTVQKNLEAAGLVAKVVPVAYTYVNINGTNYTDH